MASGLPARPYLVLSPRQQEFLADLINGPARIFMPGSGRENRSTMISTLLAHTRLVRKVVRDNDAWVELTYDGRRFIEAVKYR